MKAKFPSWIDKSVIEGLEDVSGLIVVNRTDYADFLEGPLSIVLPEPRATHPEVYYFVQENIRKYHRIYTFDKTLLEKAPQARKLLFGTSWIKESDALSALTDSKVGISFLCGSKDRIIGQRHRQTIYRAQMELEAATGLQLDFWRSCKDHILPAVCPRGNRIIHTDGSAKWGLHRPYHYSIVTENSQQDNYFTEKILDCFLSKTVPIYWGCPNIGEFFSLQGIIFLNGPDPLKELEVILKRCDSELYDSMIPAIEYNYKEAFKYAFNYSDRLKELVHQ